MRIVFFGTPDFAVPSLKRLAGSPYSVVGIVTQPDRPKGRGLQMTASPIKLMAQELRIPVFQPEGLKDPQFLHQLNNLKADIFIVVGFRILPSEIFELPPMGTINLHASLLPKYRGAAPIQWAIMNGDKETGITTFFIEKRVDTGAILLQDKAEIAKEETAGELHDRLAVLGAELLAKTVDLLVKGTLENRRQAGTPTRAPKILPEHCQINWNRSAVDIYNQVRGLSPFPGAFTQLENKRIKIFRVSVVDIKNNPLAKQGEIVLVSDGGIVVKTGQQYISIQELQMEGKRRLRINEFLRGNSISQNISFQSVC